MTVNELLNKKFDRTAVGGYKIDDVNSFVLAATDELERTIKEKAELESKLVLLATRLEEYRVDEESMRAALLGAQKLGDNIIKESQAKAETLLTETNKEAQNILSSAKSEAERIISESKLQLEAEVYALNKMKREVSRFKQQMIAMYQQHIALIEGIPSLEENIINKTVDSVEDKAPKLSNPITTNFTRGKNGILSKDENKPLDLKDGFRIIKEDE